LAEGEDLSASGDGFFILQKGNSAIKFVLSMAAIKPATGMLSITLKAY